jgi:hypothetical protein
MSVHAPEEDGLRRHRENRGGLRVLTTTYTGSTEAKALDALRDLGADIRVSYDTSSTRLHDKAWLFHRRSGFSTAYIGSSNLTHSAQVSGLEWNVRVSGARNPDVITKVAAVFEGYWNSGDFVPYDPEQFAAEAKRLSSHGPTVLLSPIELRPEPFQERLLEQIELSRQMGHHRNLLVAATGTGKTVWPPSTTHGCVQGCLAPGCSSWRTARKSSTRVSPPFDTLCASRPSVSDGWVGGGRDASSMSSLRFRA